MWPYSCAPYRNIPERTDWYRGTRSPANRLWLSAIFTWGMPIDNILTAITNGYSNLFQAAQTEYMKSPAPVIYRIVAFGHTHQPMIDVFPAGSQYTSIYANSGSWVDEKQSSHKVRTYLLITPGAWSGSALDVVSLYQYNPATAGGFEPTLIKEESIESL